MVQQQVQIMQSSRQFEIRLFYLVPRRWSIISFSGVTRAVAAKSTRELKLWSFWFKKRIHFTSQSQFRVENVVLFVAIWVEFFVVVETLSHILVSSVKATLSY